MKTKTTIVDNDFIAFVKKNKNELSKGKICPIPKRQGQFVSIETPSDEFRLITSHKIDGINYFVFCK